MSPLKALFRTVVGLIIMVGGVRIIAGRWDLPMVWIYLGVYLGYVLLLWLFVLRKDPELVQERQQPGPDAKRWDKTWLRLYTLFLVLTFVVALLDVSRLHWSDTVPLWLQVVSLLVSMVAMTFGGWAIAENTYFSEVVRIQRDRGHTVITTGPYQLVRHPGYLSNTVIMPCMTLAFGSWLALIPAGIVVALFVVRTALEDLTLQNELDGYAEYVQTVRCRLVPGIW